MKRRQAALLFADIAGYTRLIEADEQRTTIAVKALFDAVIQPELSTYGGRLVQVEGDGFFAEFADTRDAVRFGISLQRAVSGRNTGQDKLHHIEFRIGINYGDVIVDEDTGRLSGTAVNIAARLENIADVGGIWVSESVYANIGTEGDIIFTPLGSRRLKNIAGRVPVFGVIWDEDQDQSLYAGYSREQFRTINVSIAVLPFRMLDAEASEAHLSTAVAEDVMTELGRFSEISVLSPEGDPSELEGAPGVRELGRRLAADYLVTGSVNRAGDQVRIHARLFETESGEQIWANRYDSSLKEIFMLQDEVARDLASKLPLRLESALLTRSHLKPIESLDAYECYLQGRALYREKTSDTDQQAINLLERAIDLDPEFADPYTVLGAIHASSWAYSCWGPDPNENILKGRDLIKKALSMNQNLPRAHAHLAWTYLSTGQFDEARDCFEIAISLNPNDPDVLLFESLCKHLHGGAAGVDPGLRSADAVEPELSGLVYRCARRRTIRGRRLPVCSRVYATGRQSVSRKQGVDSRLPGPPGYDR